MGKLGILHSNSRTFQEGASTMQDVNTSYSILYHSLVNREWLGDLTWIWRNKKSPFHFQPTIKIQVERYGAHLFLGLKW